MHGGALMTLADSIGAACAFLGLPDGARTSTTTSSTQLMRPLLAGTATATARALQRGRTQIVVQTEVRDLEGRLISLTTPHQAELTCSDFGPPGDSRSSLRQRRVREAAGATLEHMLGAKPPAGRKP